MIFAPLRVLCSGTVTKITNLLLASESESRALAQITENESQVVIRLIPYGAEHVSIHAQGSSLLKTYSMPDKPPSTWDAARVEVARALGYRDPEKHGKYADHRPLVEPYLFELGDHLVSRRVEFASLSKKAKYTKHPLTAVLPHDPALVELYFRRDRAPSLRGEHLFEVETTLGWLYVAAKPPASASVTVSSPRSLPLGNAGAGTKQRQALAMAKSWLFGVGQP